MERLQKFLSRAGVASRRASERMIAEGLVSVNGNLVVEMGVKIDPEKDRVEVEGKLIYLPTKLLYFLINKPRGYICTLDDPQERKIITDLLPKRTPRVWPVGRLDWDSEGLIILTNDGALTNLLTHPKFEVDKLYAVKVKGKLEKSDPGFKQLREGVVDLETGKTMVAKTAHFFKSTGQNTWIEIILTSGQNRQIRRMCEALGWEVTRLRRIAIADITMKGVSMGKFRNLEQHEVQNLYNMFEKTTPEEAISSKRAKKRERQNK